jgi:hypothetical protein
MWNCYAAWLPMLCMIGCATPGALPELSLRALTVWHQHVPASEGRGVDVALMAQVSFAARHPRRQHLARQPTTQLNPWTQAVACTDEALCSWASALEQSTLVALGVPP